MRKIDGENPRARAQSRVIGMRSATWLATQVTVRSRGEGGGKGAGKRTTMHGAR